jgi:hypothetical protein
MPASTFSTKASAAVGVGRTKVGAYSVPASRVAIVIGWTVTNDYTDTVNVTVEYSPDGSTFFKITNNMALYVGQTLCPLEGLGKLAVPATGGIYVTSSVAASLDAVATVLEKDA